MIYHITTETDWATNEPHDYYIPSAYTREGFIHASNATQVERTANRIFKSQPAILLLVIDDKKEKDFIKYENLDGGEELFPHIYRRLPKTSIEKVIPFKQVDGMFSFAGKL